PLRSRASRARLQRPGGRPAGVPRRTGDRDRRCPPLHPRASHLPVHYWTILVLVSIQSRDMSGFDTSAPSIARVYDFWLGGKDNSAVDRELGERLLALYPPTAEIVRENKQFLSRAVTWGGESGDRPVRRPRRRHADLAEYAGDRSCGALRR